jgi:Ca-activated chloride channel family protein
VEQGETLDRHRAERKVSMHRRAFIQLAALAAPNLGVALPAGATDVTVVAPPCDFGCPEPVPAGDRLDIRSRHVDVTIADQVAATRIDQVFHNPNDWTAEAVSFFPIPGGATIEAFAMEVDGEPVEAEILSAEEARRIYVDIVRERRDPALLEYAGRGAIRASVFPIPPGEDRTIAIEYREILPVEGGLVRYTCPLGTERFSATPVEEASVHVEVESNAPIRAIYSPTHDIAVDREGDRRFSAGWEASDLTPETDFELLYGVSDQAIGVNLISHRDPESGEGTFLLLAAPGIAADQPTVAKDIIVVLDTSGSMEGDKIAQARDAAGYILDNLNAEDRFAIVEFSTGVRQYDDEPRPASDAEDAIAWVRRLEATGGTDINPALLEAMQIADAERPTYIIFLTDGLPTEGETDVSAILANIREAAPDNVRLFAFGVGYDVDTVLLDTLARDHHGSSAYVEPGERIDETVSAFYARVSTPLLTNVELVVNGPTIEEVYPRPLPDIFAGSQLIVTGRYREGDTATIRLTGEVDGERQSYTYDDIRFRESGGDDSLPRLWATRKIGYLLTEIRLRGENPELVDAIVDLSIRYGIVTPYTSYLITEDDILTEEGRADAAREVADAAAPLESGEAAVGQSQAVATMAESDTAAPVSVESAEGNALRVVGSRAFVRQGGVWIQTMFDPSRMVTVKVQFAGDDYFALLDRYPDLAGAFALGDRVIVFSHGVAFEVTTEEQPPLDLDALPAA